MKHAIIPFPAGLQQGELVLHLQLEDGDDPDDVVEKLLIAHSRRPIGEVLVAPGELSGARGRALALALTQRWEIAIIGSLRDTAWPSTPARVVLDCSVLFVAPMTDEDFVISDLTAAMMRVPQAQELFAVATVREALDPRLLHILNQIVAPEFGSTLYVEPALLPAALAASLKIERPWAIRPPTFPGPAPAAASSG